MRAALAAWLLMTLCLATTLATAAPVEELRLLGEHPVEGMRDGNLSGLAICGGELYTESDRDDDRIYRLDTRQPVWQAEAQRFDVPTPAPSGLSWGMNVRTWAAGFVRGGTLDFEGISCDAAGNRYLVSEARAQVLKISPEGEAQWLNISPALVREARAAGLLAHFNAIFEGLAINPAGDQLWLAAERSRRGLLKANLHGSEWTCDGACVLLSEDGVQARPAAAMPSDMPLVIDFSDLAWFNGKLYTLERNAYQICRRDTRTVAVERCWSFADAALTPARRYAKPYGVAEALVVDAQGAWIGNDNNDWARGDGDVRPIVWRFAAPVDGWEARP
ncbi:MAG: esterase-like activity of phytase family protein [Janthinobacterium lividum]